MWLDNRSYGIWRTGVSFAVEISDAYIENANNQQKSQKNKA